MLTIEKIKEYCIQIDLLNVLSDNKSIGAKDKDRSEIIFSNEKEIRLFYHSVSSKKLLEIFAAYNGLECYKKDEPKEYRESYNLDILSIIELLNN